MSRWNRLSKQDYRVQCAKSEEIPLFLQAWYLDAAVGTEAWDVVYFAADQQLWAALPYCLAVGEHGTAACTPAMTQYAGPYIHLPDGSKLFTRYSRMEQALDLLFSALEEKGLFAYGQRWGTWVEDFLPMYWKRYTQTTRITYRLACMDGYTAIYQNYGTQVRNKLKNTQSVSLREMTDCTALYDMMVTTLQRQGKTPKYPLSVLQNVHEACTYHHCCRLLGAYNEDRLLAAAYFLWDQSTMYYYLGGQGDDAGGGYGPTLLIDAGIRLACEKMLMFDFAGSMLPSLSKFYQSFGASMTQYSTFFSVYTDDVAMDAATMERLARELIFKF